MSSMLTILVDFAPEVMESDITEAHVFFVYPIPIGQLRSFLMGLLNYYSRFIQDSSRITVPSTSSFGTICSKTGKFATTIQRASSDEQNTDKREGGRLLKQLRKFAQMY